MPASDFSEFAFGFAFTHEVVSQIKADLDAVPGIPNQNEEGALGYDLRLAEVEGWTFIAQFKIPMRLTTSRSSQWEDWNAPYLRFSTRPASAQQAVGQHELLLALENASVFNMVQYVAPCFSRLNDFNAAFVAGEIEGRSIKLRPSEIGTGDHVVTYDETGRHVIYSEPRFGQTDMRNRSVRELGGFAEEQRGAARRLDAASLKSVEERMWTVVEERSQDGFRRLSAALSERRRAASADRSEAVEAFEDLSTAVRLLTGGQLFSIPVPRAADSD